jgi:hypothetical protein
MPKSATQTPGEKDSFARRLATSTPKPSSAKKLANEFELAWGEEKTVPGLAHQADVPAGIVVENHANVKLAFVILLHGFNGRDFSLERKIKNISPRIRPQPHAVAALDLDALNLKRLNRIFFFQELPFPFVHGVSPFARRKPRNTP